MDRERQRLVEIAKTEGEKNASVLLKKRKEKKKKERKKLVHIACFRFVPSPKATVAAS